MDAHADCSAQCCQNDDPSHGHEHDHEHDHGNPFLMPFIAITVFAVIEFIGSWWTHSLALLSDAWHMLSDVSALALAMWAAHLSRHHAGSQKMEWRVSLLNAVMMLLVCLWIIKEAVERFQYPQAVAGGYVSLIAIIGLLVNLYVAKHMHHQHHHHGGDSNLNHRAAFLHVLGDLLGSVAAVTAGVVIYFTGWMAIDPILSLLISALLLVATINLLRDIYQHRSKADH